MKKTIVIVSLIFSLLFINESFPQSYCKNDSFNNIANNIANEYSFVENGIRMEYYSNNTESIELEKIYKNISKRVDTKINKNVIIANDKLINYLISVYTIDKKTKVNIEIVNTNSKINIDYLVNRAEELQGNCDSNSRIYKYLKVKSDIDNKLLKDAKENIKLDTKRSLFISNGIVNNVIMSDGNRLNIAKVNYNSGSYLIIGTPTIFVTY